MIAWAVVRAETAPASNNFSATTPSDTLEVSGKDQQWPPEKITLTQRDEELLRSLPLKTKIGQLLMIGFMGQNLTDGIGKSIASVKPGALVVFARNISSAKQIATLNLDAQKASMKASQLPLLIAVDQEGGDVIRIKTAMPLPSALALGETENPALLERAGFATGRLLRVLGFNMNLAPVMDIADPAQPSFIGTRTYGSDPERVVRMGVSFSDGLHRARILPTAKHFPGHGGVNADSHKVVPKKGSSFSELADFDLVPFFGMKKEFSHPWAVMLAHISLPHIDPTGMPATFSKPIVEGILRQKMAFNGIVLTDDIEMAGAGAIKDVGERAVRAIEAGADMIMIAWNKKIQSLVVDALTKAVQSGRLSQERLDLSLRRIIATKRAYGSSPQKAPSHEEVRLVLKNPEFSKIAEETVLSKLSRSKELKPDLLKEHKSIFVFSADERFYRQFKASSAKKDVRHYPIGAAQKFNIDRVMRANPEALGIIYVSGQRTARVANAISEDVARRMFLITTEVEGSIQKTESFGHISDVYFRHPRLGHFMAEHYFQTKNESSLRQPSASSRGPDSGK